MDALHPERGSVVLGALTKLLVVALIAVVAFDAASIGYTHVQASDHGTTAAVAAADVWNDTADVNEAYRAAEKSLAGSGATILPTTFAIGPDKTVTFEVRATAKTVIVQRLSFMRQRTVQVVHISAAPMAPGS